MLLFEARAGSLRTKMYRRRFEDNVDVTCLICGTEEETVGDLVLECEGQGDETNGRISGEATLENEQADLARALGFSGENRSVDYNMVARTKWRLGEWWFKSRLG